MKEKDQNIPTVREFREWARNKGLINPINNKHIKKERFMKNFFTYTGIFVMVSIVIVIFAAAFNSDRQDNGWMVETMEIRPTIGAAE